MAVYTPEPQIAQGAPCLRGLSLKIQPTVVLFHGLFSVFEYEGLVALPFYN